VLNISFAWWNTSLSPSAKPRANDAERQIAIAVICFLLFEEGIDFLALGEMSEEDILVLRQLNDLDDYMIESGVSKTGRVTFDTCFIYRPDKITIDNPIEEIDTGRSGKSIKIAQKLILNIATIEQPFYLFVSHWASRLWCHENGADRHLLGIRLRDAIDNIYADDESEPFVILLGDYNDEPFDIPLAQQLMATRDKALVKRKKNLLYNPFWRHLTYPDTNLNYAGTHYYKKETTEWHTFDQIIVSSAFLNGDEWLLNEIATGIVYIPEYLQQVKNRNAIFDHLPVKTIIEKVR
jgi:hypothetical protein